MKKPGLPALLASLLPLLAPVAGAQQDPKPAKLLLPPQPTLVLHVKGPAAIARIHAEDAMGRQLRSDAMRALWKGFLQDLQPLLKQWSADLPEESPVTPQQLLEAPEAIAGFDGSITVGLWLDSRIDVTDPDPAQIAAVLQFDPGGGSTAPVLAVLRKLFDDRCPDARDLALAGVSTRVGRLPGGRRVECTRPFVYAEQVCCAVSGDVEAFLERSLAARETHRPLLERLAESSFHLELDFHGPVQVAERVRAAQDASPVTRGVQALEGILGLGAMERAWFSIGSKDRRSYTDWGIGFRSEPRGLLACLLPGEGEVSAMQRYLPYQLQGSSLLRVDLAALLRQGWDLAGKLFEASGREPPPALETVADGFRRRMDLRLFEDLLDHLGRDLMLLDHATVPNEDELAEEEDPRVEKIREKLEGKCVAIALRDGAAFAKSLERLVRKLALHTGRKRAEHAGQRVYTLRNPLFGGLEFHYAMHPRCALLGVGRDGLTCLHAVLDELRAGENGEERKPPEEVRKLLDTVPDGYYAAGHANLREIKALAVNSMTFAEQLGIEDWDVVVPESVTDPRARRLLANLFSGAMRVFAEMQLHGSGYSVVVSRYRDRRFSVREIW